MTEAEQIAKLKEEFSKENLKEVKNMLKNGTDYSVLESTLEEWVATLRKVLWS